MTDHTDVPNQPTDPTTVPASRLRAALETLGIGDWDDIAQIDIEPMRIAVTRFRRDESGQVVVAGDEAAKTTTTIGITHEEETTDA